MDLLCAVFRQHGCGWLSRTSLWGKRSVLEIVSDDIVLTRLQDCLNLFVLFWLVEFPDFTIRPLWMVVVTLFLPHHTRNEGACWNSSCSSRFVRTDLVTSSFLSWSDEHSAIPMVGCDGDWWISWRSCVGPISDVATEKPLLTKNPTCSFVTVANPNGSPQLSRQATTCDVLVVHVIIGPSFLPLHNQQLCWFVCSGCPTSPCYWRYRRSVCFSTKSAPPVSWPVCMQPAAVATAWSTARVHWRCRV
jgi:hypothetical protein